MSTLTEDAADVRKMERIELFRPCNGTHGEIFIADHCGKCERDRQYRENDVDPCEILGRTFMYDVEHPDYPKEWRYVNGEPTCTAFVPEGETLPVPRCDRTVDMFEVAK